MSKVESIQVIVNPTKGTIIRFDDTKFFEAGICLHILSECLGNKAGFEALQKMFAEAMKEVSFHSSQA